MNGDDFELPDEDDLLPIARRLFRRRIGRCSLGDIERTVLRTYREVDIPGALVPGRYFDFLRSGDYEPLLPVFEHHLEDIVSLWRLDAAVAEITGEGPTALHRPYVDPIGLATHLDRCGRDGGTEVLQSAFDRLVGDQRYDVGRVLATRLRRIDGRSTAAPVWRAIWEEARDVTAAIELAKYLEHDLRSYHEALAVVESCVGADGEADTALARRIDRLRRRIVLGASGAAG
jgi:uncharacterized protein